jgi:hypothetical protein
MNRDHARPPGYQYDDFNARMPEEDKPYPSEDEPAGKRCREIFVGGRGREK